MGIYCILVHSKLGYDGYVTFDGARGSEIKAASEESDCASILEFIHILVHPEEVNYVHASHWNGG